MKKIIIMILVAVIFTSCKKDNNNNNNNGIVIKGKISKSASVKMTSLKSGNSLTLADAKKVLVYSKYYYSLTDIVDGVFSVTGQVGTGVALIFLDANNQYIGNLSSRGLNVLPLGSMKDGANTSIDLSTLTLDGTNVIPAHDPFGNEIIITEMEINCLKMIGGYYKSIAKNLDADNDGVPDVLTKSQIVLSTHYGINGGHWGLNNSLPILSDSAHYYINYGLEFGGGAALTFANGNIKLAGPNDNPHTDIIKWGYMMAPQTGADRGFIAGFNRQGDMLPDVLWRNNFLPFKDGTYSLTLDDNKTYTLDYSCVDVKFNLVIVVPTLHTNSEGKVTSITFDYKLPKGTIINPASMLTNVMIQFFDQNNHMIYVNDKNTQLTSETGFKDLTPGSPIDISTLYTINLEYDDLLGNHYVIVWR